MTDADDLVEVLSRRHGILRSLLDEPKERYVLVDDLDSSKSTVYKGVSQLQERGLIRQTSEGLQPTLFGVVALERYREMERTSLLGGLLRDLPSDTIDPAALVGAEAVVPDRESVDRHLARLERMFQTADSIRGFPRAISPEQSLTFHERAVNDYLEAELVLPEKLLRHLYREDPEGLDKTLAADDIVILQTDREPRISLFLASSPVGREVYIGLGEAGLSTGVIVNDTPETLRWAETRFERMKRGAEPVTTDDLPPE